MDTKHNVWKKLLATGSALGALLVGAAPTQAANPDVVPLGPLAQGVGLSEHPVKLDRVAFTVHSYVAYGAVDVTGVQDGAPFTGVSFTNVATPACTGVPIAPPPVNGTNLFDGDIWYVGCVGIWGGITGAVTVN